MKGSAYRSMRLWTWLYCQLCWCSNFPSPPSQIHHALGELCTCWFGTDQLQWVIYLWVQAQGPVVQRWTTLSSTCPGKASLFHLCWPCALAPFCHLWSMLSWARFVTWVVRPAETREHSWDPSAQRQGRKAEQWGRTILLALMSPRHGRPAKLTGFCRISQKLEQVKVFLVFDTVRKMTKLSCTHLIWLKAWISPDAVQLLSPQDHTFIGISL